MVIKTHNDKGEPRTYQKFRCKSAKTTFKWTCNLKGFEKAMKGI